jgi:hypothetical protein|tara:strand:+ start:462 stop:695 length:234 start_codon:yes stop_codon:yes gene_type:complete
MIDRIDGYYQWRSWRPGSYGPKTDALWGDDSNVPYRRGLFIGAFAVVSDCQVFYRLELSLLSIVTGAWSATDALASY